MIHPASRKWSAGMLMDSKSQPRILLCSRRSISRGLSGITIVVGTGSYIPRLLVILQTPASLFVNCSQELVGRSEQ